MPYALLLQLFHAHLRHHGVAVRWTHPMATEKGIDLRARVREQITRIAQMRAEAFDA